MSGFHDINAIDEVTVGMLFGVVAILMPVLGSVDLGQSDEIGR